MTRLATILLAFFLPFALVSGEAVAEAVAVADPVPNPVADPAPNPVADAPEASATPDQLATLFGGCNYKRLTGKPWYNCNDANGGTDPCARDFNCGVGCKRAENIEKFVIVAEYNGPEADSCTCKCYLA